MPFIEFSKEIFSPSFVHGQCGGSSSILGLDDFVSTKLDSFGELLDFFSGERESSLQKLILHFHSSVQNLPAKEVA